MSSREKTGFFHMLVGLMGGYMSLMVGDIAGITTLVAATANVLYACFLLLGTNVAD